MSTPQWLGDAFAALDWQGDFERRSPLTTPCVSALTSFAAAPCPLPRAQEPQTASWWAVNVDASKHSIREAQAAFDAWLNQNLKAARVRKLQRHKIRVENGQIHRKNQCWPISTAPAELLLAHFTPLCAALSADQHACLRRRLQSLFKK